MALLRVEGLPQGEVEAAAAFHALFMPRAQVMLDGGLSHLTLLFPTAEPAQRGWRLAVVQALARTHVPARVNAIASHDAEAIAAALRYLEGAEGVTGQYLDLAGEGAGPVLD